MQLVPEKRCYTRLTKIYAYCLFNKSKEAYNFIRLVNIDVIEEQLTDISKVNEIIKSHEDIIGPQKFDVVLSVDAFSTTVIMKDEKKENKNIYFEGKKHIWITNPLHIFKNGRSWIINNKVLINPEIPDQFVNSEDLNEILNLGPALLDKSLVGKLRYIYPISIFYLNC